jgi:hypothetical protein
MITVIIVNNTLVIVPLTMSLNVALYHPLVMDARISSVLTPTVLMVELLSIMSLSDITNGII